MDGVKFTRHTSWPFGPRDNRCLLMIISTQHHAWEILSVGADFSSAWGLSRCQTPSKIKSTWSD